MHSKDIKLKKYNIDLSKYEAELTDLGLNEEQAKSIILKKCSPKSVKSLIQYYPDMKKLGFDTKQIMSMISRHGGPKNLVTVIKNKDALEQLGFNIQQIVSMVSHNGGSKNLEAVIKNIDVLTKLEINIEQIVSMASYDGGSKNLEAAIKNKNELENIGFNINDIVRMVSHNGGSKNLEAVIKNIDELEKLGFNIKDIVSLVSRKGGSKRLEENLARFNATQESSEISSKNFNQDEMILNFDDAVPVLKLKLLGLSLSEEQADSILKKWPRKNIETLIQYYPDMQTLRFEQADILRMAKRNTNSLQSVRDNQDKLTMLGFNAKQIVRMVSHSGGAKNLDAAIKNKDELERLEFNIEQIVSMVSQSGGSKNLETVINYKGELEELGFNIQQIVSIASHHGASNYLEVIIKNKATLKKSGLNINHIIVKIISQERSSKHLEECLASFKATQQSPEISSKDCNDDEMMLNFENAVSEFGLFAPKLSDSFGEFTNNLILPDDFSDWEFPPLPITSLYNGHESENNSPCSNRPREHNDREYDSGPEDNFIWKRQGL